MDERKRPFPTFVLWLLVFMLSLLWLLVRCNASVFAREPANITVTAEGQRLNWVVRKITWNSTAYDRVGTVFDAYASDVGPPSQAAAGETVSIAIEGAIPDSVALLEYALEPDQSSVYGDEELLEERYFYFSGVTGTFTLPEPGEHPVRGYLLRCSWGKNECEYAIVVQILEE